MYTHVHCTYMNKFACFVCTRSATTTSFLCMHFFFSCLNFFFFFIKQKILRALCLRVYKCRLNYIWFYKRKRKICAHAARGSHRFHAYATHIGGGVAGCLSLYVIRLYNVMYLYLCMLYTIIQFGHLKKKCKRDGITFFSHYSSAIS